MSKKKGQTKFDQAQPASAQTSRTKASIRRFIIFAGAGALILIVAYYFLRPWVQKGRDAAHLALPAAMIEDVVFFPKPSPAPSYQEPVFDDFIGAEACAECHNEQYDLWRNSTHGRAGGKPSAQNVIGAFNGKAFHYQDAEVTPAVDAEQRYTFTVKQKGFPDEVLAVAAVIGGGHLAGGGTQSYFAEFPDGTLRFLPFDFSRQKQAWFSQHRDSKEWRPVNELSIDALTEWPPTRILGAEGALTNCQNCHASQLLVQYDTPKQRYVTQYTSLDINCESCHGPGKRHVELARADQLDGAEDIGMKPLATLSKDESLKICLSCHAVKDELDNAYLPGKELDRHYSLMLPILAENPHLADGRVAAFAYQQNHLYSDCYLNGSMTCVDCHDPHSQNYRDISGRELPGRFDNGQCLDCHASKSEAPEQHTHHQKNSAGSLCANCHTPYLQHRGIGTQVPFARSDHSIPIPRPAFDAQLGIENACQKCHPQKEISWLEAKTREWYGELKPHKEAVAGLLQAEEVSDRLTASRMLLHPGTKHPMAQAAGLSDFIKRFLQPDMPALEPEIVEKLQALCKEDDLDLKAFALMSLHLARGREEAIRAFLLAQLQTLGRREIPVRARWALALDYLGTRYAGDGEYAKAIAAHKKALEIQSDDPVTLVNLGNAHGNQGDLDQAMAWFQAALRVDPANAQAAANLGSTYARRQDAANAAQAYLQAVKLRPSDPFNHLLLARMYVESGQVEPAIAALKVGLAYVPYDREMKWLLRELEAMRVNQK